MVEDEADIVRRVFAWVGLDRLSLSEVSRRLQRIGCRSRRGLARWGGTALRDMLDQSGLHRACRARAVAGRARRTTVAVNAA